MQFRWTVYESWDVLHSAGAGGHSLLFGNGMASRSDEAELLHTAALRCGDAEVKRTKSWGLREGSLWLLLVGFWEAFLNDDHCGWD